MSKLEDEVKELRAEVDRLKPTPMPTEQDVARHRDEMHKIAEDRASRAAHTFFSREDLAAMRAACPDAQAIVRDHQNAPRGPTFDGAGNSHSAHLGGGAAPVNTTGWREPPPLGPQPHIQHVDRLMDAQDRRDKADLIRAEAMRRAAERKAKGR